MRRWLVLVVMAVSSLMLVGCGDGVARSKEDRFKAIQRGLELNARMMNDDIDLLILNTRPSRLSRYNLP